MMNFLENLKDVVEGRMPRNEAEDVYEGLTTFQRDGPGRQIPRIAAWSSIKDKIENG